MDLDHRAAEASALLRDEVADVDLDAAYGRVIAGGSRRQARRAGARLGIAALVGVVAVGALAVVATGGAGRSIGGDRFEEAGSGGGDVALSARGAAILGGLPDGPLDGRESWRLPVVADRSTGLAEGDQVTLYGKGFVPGELVGAVHCSSEADVASAGVGACDLGDGFSHTISGSARSDGSVVITVTIRRHITTPGLGPVDCLSAAERCLLAIGAADDYDRSGGTYIDLAGAPPFPEPTVTVDPPGPYTAGQAVTIGAAGLVPGRQYQVLQCVGEGEGHCASLSMGRVGADGTYGATVAIGAAVDVEGDVRPCADTCTLAVRGVGLPEQTSAPVPAAVPLGPIAGEGTVAAVPPTTTAPDPATAVAPDSIPAVPPSTELPPTTGELPPTTSSPTTSTTATTMVTTTTTAPR